MSTGMSIYFWNENPNQSNFFRFCTVWMARTWCCHTLSNRRTYRCVGPVGPPRFHVLSVSLAPVVASQQGRPRCPCQRTAPAETLWTCCVRRVLPRSVEHDDVTTRILTDVDLHDALKEVPWNLDRLIREWRKGNSAMKYKIPSWAYSKCYQKR